MMDLPARLEPVLAGLGYELVMLERAGRGLMRIFIDKPGGVTIDDCVAVSNHLTHLFTVENIDYDRLEVSSPGLDRPLKKAADYARFAAVFAARYGPFVAAYHVWDQPNIAPHVDDPVVKSLADIHRLQVPDPERTPPLDALLKATRIIVAETAGRVFVNGRADQGPVALALALCGPERFLTWVGEPETRPAVHRLLDICSRMNIALGEAQIRAETEQMRSGLLIAVSHDLRTPLAAITGAGGVLVLRRMHDRVQERR